MSLPPRCDREIRTFTDIYPFETSLFLRLWVSRLLSKLRRLPAVRYLHSTHCDIDLIVIEGIVLSVCGSVCLKDTRICWVLGAFGFLHSNGRCVGGLYLDTSYYWLRLRALRTSYFLCHTRYYMITNGRRSQKWTFRMWRHISCRKSILFLRLPFASVCLSDNLDRICVRLMTDLYLLGRPP